MSENFTSIEDLHGVDLEKEQLSFIQEHGEKILRELSAFRTRALELILEKGDRLEDDQKILHPHLDVGLILKNVPKSHATWDMTLALDKDQQSFLFIEQCTAPESAYVEHAVPAQLDFTWSGLERVERANGLLQVMLYEIVRRQEAAKEEIESVAT
jgi:hypothetical protein